MTKPRNLFAIIGCLAVAVPLVAGGVTARRNFRPLSHDAMQQPSLRGLIDEGLAHYQAGRLAQALGAWRQALVLAPNDPLAYNNIGSALMGLSRPAEARVAFLKAKTLDPKQALYSNNLAWADRELEKLGAANSGGVR